VLRGRRGAEDERKCRRLAEGGGRSGRWKEEWKQKGFPLQEKDKKQQKIHILLNIGISTWNTSLPASSQLHPSASAKSRTALVKVDLECLNFSCASKNWHCENYAKHIRQ